MLNVEGLSVCYGPICAVRKIDLQVRPGEIVALIGANGAGKSTLDITRWKTEKVVAAGISVVPEGRGMLADMTVLENLQLGAYHHKGDYGPMLEKVFSYFPILNDRKTQKAGTLSGGEQQMLAISRALMGEPRLVLLDEPSLALSPAYVDKIFRFLVEMKRQGLTILLSEQNARKALQYADRGYVLDLGVTVMEGPARQLADDPEVRRAYLGGE